MLTNEYWEERYRVEEKARELADKGVAYQLHGVYQQHANNIQKEIDSFWQRYADREGITKLEAKQRADRLDMINVEFKAKQLVERANRLRERGKKVTSDDFTRAENDLMRLYNLKMKTSRLEVLQANIKLHQYDLALNEFEIIDRHLIESIRRENLFSAGVLNMTLGSFDASKISADSIVYANFNGASWSSRVWERQNELRDIVKRGVADTVLRGKGTNVLINNLKKEFDVSYGYARRLAVTESARVYSEAQKANYDSNGVEWFEVMTELKACPICQPFNRRIFKVSELVPALNAPPFHPNCRCTTVPHFLIDLKRVGRDEEFLHADMNNKNQSSKYIAKDGGKMYNQGVDRNKNPDKRRPVNITKQKELLRNFKESGGFVWQDDKAAEYLKTRGVDACCLGRDLVVLQKRPLISEILEELFHAEQFKNGLVIDGEGSKILAEIEAQEYLISVAEEFNIPKSEQRQTENALEKYKQKLKELKKHEE